MECVRSRRKFLRHLTILTIGPYLVYGNSRVNDLKPYRIGFLNGAGIGDLQEAFIAELRTLGFTEGQNAELGGLMAWAPDLPEQFREAARFVAKILNGAKPEDLAVKHPAKYYLTLNNVAAKQIGITFPPEMLALARKVIS